MVMVNTNFSRFQFADISKLVNVYTNLAVCVKAKPLNNVFEETQQGGMGLDRWPTGFGNGRIKNV
jgi:hypothetical protein